MVRLICLALNALAGAVVILYVTVEPTVGWTGHPDELVFYLLTSLLFLLIAAGLLFRIRWMVDIPAIALFLGGLLLAYFFPAGGGVVLLEILSIIAAARMKRTAVVVAASPSP